MPFAMVSRDGCVRWGWRLALLAASASAQCYLEDATSICAACWQTRDNGDQTLGSCKSDGVIVEWLTPLPESLSDSVGYHVEYRVKVNTTVYPLLPVEVKNSGVRVQVPHTNLHSCIQTGTACTPFVQDSPGLSTHTAALWGNLTVSQDGDILSETFRTEVKLEEGRYTIIVHVRFFTPVNGELVKVDAAVGVKRDVLPLEAETDPSAYVGAAGIGATVLTLGVSLGWAVKRGKLNVDVILAAITREEVLLVADCVFGLADIVAFSVGLFTEIIVQDALKDIVPLSFMFLVTGWIAFIISLVFNIKQLLLMWQRHNCEDIYLRQTVMKVIDQNGQQTTAALRKQDTFDILQSVNKTRHFIEYDRASTKVLKMYIGLTTLVFTDIPLACIGAYTLAKGDQGAMVVAVAMISSLFVGLKMNEFANFRHTKQKLQAAKAALSGVADVPQEPLQCQDRLDSELDSQEAVRDVV